MNKVLESANAILGTSSPNEYLTDKQIKLNTKVRLENLELNSNLMVELLDSSINNNVEFAILLAKTMQTQIKTLKENI